MQKFKTTSFFKQNIETTIYWIDRGQLWLIYQIYNSDHETIIFYIKKIKVNYKTQFSINLVLENEIEKNQLKNQTESTC